jgi:hypothetical protein
LDSEAAKEKSAFAFCLPDGAAWREAESIRSKIIKINYLQQILHVYYLNNTKGNSDYFLEKIEFFPFFLPVHPEKAKARFRGEPGRFSLCSF